MRYPGGKTRQGAVIAKFIDEEFVRLDLTNYEMNRSIMYIEPFCGALGVASKVTTSVDKVLSDANPALIVLHNYASSGGDLPDTVSDFDFNEVKSLKDPADWRTAYFGFGLSFGGNFFASNLIKHNGSADYYTKALKKSLLAKYKAIGTRSTFINKDYHYFCDQVGQVFYLDPPYWNTRPKTYGDFSTFDHDKFWSFVDNLSERNIVFVSEFTIPERFQQYIIHDFGVTVAKHHNTKSADFSNKRSEKLIKICKDSFSVSWLPVNKDFK